MAMEGAISVPEYYAGKTIFLTGATGMSIFIATFKSITIYIINKCIVKNGYSWRGSNKGVLTV